MSNLELISYKEYPQDQYTKALATVRIDGKHCVTYGKKITKQGTEFWAPATFNVTENGEKKFVDGYLVDSRMEEKQILDFIRSAGRLPHKAEPNSIFKKPTSMDEVADNATLPF